jgi:hypothetical protein
MKRFIILIPVFIFFITNVYSQDTIFMKNDEFVISKVTEILPEIVKYKKYENLNGPDYTINKSDIKRIVYQNGSVDEFNTLPVNYQPKQDRQKAHAIFVVGYTLSTLGADALYTEYDNGVVASFGVDFPYGNSATFFEFMLSYEEKGSKFKDIDLMVDTTMFLMKGTQISMDYITLAFSVKRFFGANRMFYARAGLYAGARISGDIKSKLIRLYDNLEIDASSTLEGLYTTMEAGATLGVGLNVPITKGAYPTNLVVETRYNLGLSNIVVPGTASSSTEDYKETNQNIVFMAGLRFPF